MNLLDACGSIAGDADVHIGVAQALTHFAAAPAGQANYDHFPLMGGLNGGQYIG